MDCSLQLPSVLFQFKIIIIIKSANKQGLIQTYFRVDESYSYLCHVKFYKINEPSLTAHFQTYSDLEWGDIHTQVATRTVNVILESATNIPFCLEGRQRIHFF